MPAEPIEAADRLCFDPECGGTAEAEQQGDLVFWTCGACGYEFGYTRLTPQLVAAGSACAIGVPEHVRQAYATIALEHEGGAVTTVGVPVTIGRKR